MEKEKGPDFRSRRKCTRSDRLGACSRIHDDRLGALQQHLSNQGIT